jgi:hypothetical protein
MICRTVCGFVVVALVLGSIPAAAHAGSVFLTGHDPDFHASLGGNLTGARRINQVAITFVTDPIFNPYSAGGASKFLYVQSRISAPSGHTDGKQGIIASGYTEGTDFDHHDATTLNGALDALGTTYSAIVVCSDFGGLLTQAELDILNTRSTDIFTFVNTGGGLYAMAEGNNGAGLTPGGGWFGFVPTVIASASLNQNESGFTVSALGASLGLTDADVNGNASHNIFTQAGGMQPVDFDAAGNIMSLAGRVEIPSPAAAAPLLVLAGLARRRR